MFYKFWSIIEKQFMKINRLDVSDHAKEVWSENAFRMLKNNFSPVEVVEYLPPDLCHNVRNGCLSKEYGFLIIVLIYGEIWIDAYGRVFYPDIEGYRRKIRVTLYDVINGED